MPKPDPTQEQLDALRSDHDAQQAAIEGLRQQFDQLTAKFGPGTRFLVDLEERKAYDDTITAVKNTTTTVVIETLPGDLDAAYRVSARPTETGVVVVTNGEGTIPTNGCGVAIGREYKTSPTRIEVTVRVTNTDAANDHPVKVKVWKRMGLG